MIPLGIIALLKLIIGSLLFCIVSFISNKSIKRLIKVKVAPKPIKDKDYLNEFSVLAFFSGLLEIFLYASSFLIGKPEFILLWMGIKTALRWDRKRHKKIPSMDVQIRGLYYSFLIGNGLNIL